MYLSSPAKSLLFLATAGALGFATACVITTNGGGGSRECGSLLSNSHVTGERDADGNEVCRCDLNYTWSNPNDPDDYDCERIPDKQGDAGACVEPHNIYTAADNTCACEPGYRWCDPSAADDYCCELDPAQDTIGGTGDPSDSGTDTLAGTGSDGTAGADETGDTSDTGVPGVEPDPADCTTADDEGLQFCNNVTDEGIAGSRFWVCMGGQWVESSSVADESCQFDGYQFAYGCVATADTIEFVCGNGSGEACEGDGATCTDADAIEYCLYDRLTSDSCQRICTEVGDAKGATYENGVCADSDCCCYDEGDEANCGL